MEKTHGVNIPLAKLSKADGTIRKAKWASMKEEFIELTITGQGVHWPTLAAKYGFTPATVRNKASVNKWYADIEKRRVEREDVLEKKLTERTTMALDELNRDFATNEAAIRKRHATMARGLQGRAISRLKEIPMTDFTPRDLLAMLKLGIDEERFAMGMSQVYEGAPIESSDSTFRSLVEQIGGHQKVQRIGMVLLNALKGIDLEAEAPEQKPFNASPVYTAVPEVHDVPESKVRIIKKSA